MAISEWSDQILIANLSDEPSLSDELSGLIERVHSLESMPDIVLDFQAVSFVNSSNLSQMLRLHEVVSGHGGRLCLCGLNESVQSVLEVTRLDRLFPSQSDTAMALASLQIEGEVLD